MQLRHSLKKHPWRVATATSGECRQGDELKLSGLLGRRQPFMQPLHCIAGFAAMQR